MHQKSLAAHVKRLVVDALSDALDLVRIDNVAQGKHFSVRVGKCAKAFGYPKEPLQDYPDIGLLHYMGVSKKCR